MSLNLGKATKNMEIWYSEKKSNKECGKDFLENNTTPEVNQARGSHQSPLPSAYYRQHAKRTAAASMHQKPQVLEDFENYGWSKQRVRSPHPQMWPDPVDHQKYRGERWVTYNPNFKSPMLLWRQCLATSNSSLNPPILRCLPPASTNPSTTAKRTAQRSNS